MIYHFSMHDLNVGVINTVEVYASKVITKIIESPSTNEKIRLLCNLHLQNEMQVIMDDLTSIHKSDPDLCISLEEVEEYLVKSQKFGVRADYSLVTFAAFKLLKARKCKIYLTSALILHAIIQRNTPLSRRRFPSVEFSENREKEIAEFLEQISETTRNLVDSPFLNKLTASNSAKYCLVDCIDGRLYRIVLNVAQAPSFEYSLPSAVQKEWKILKKFFQETTNTTLFLEALNMKDGDSGSSYPSFGKIMKKNHENVCEDIGLLSFSNHIFDKYFDSLHLRQISFEMNQIPSEVNSNMKFETCQRKNIEFNASARRPLETWKWK